MASRHAFHIHLHSREGGACAWMQYGSTTQPLLLLFHHLIFVISLFSVFQSRFYFVLSLPVLLCVQRFTYVQVLRMYVCRFVFPTLCSVCTLCTVCRLYLCRTYRRRWQYVIIMFRECDAFISSHVPVSSHHILFL